MAVTCFRYFGYNSMDSVLLLDFREYRLLCKARSYRELDKLNDMAAQAFMINKASLRKKDGRLAYPSQKALFDYEKAIRRMEGRKPKPNSRLEAYKRYLREEGKHV